MSKRIVSENVRPAPHPFYGDSYERGYSPWHESCFPVELRHLAPESGERKAGWFLLDAWDQQIGFIPDGTEQ
jgi:hypothetical protein